MKTPSIPIAPWLAAALVCAAPLAAPADEFEAEPIRYSQTTPDNPVGALQSRIDSGQLQLDRDDRFGYLRAVLRELAVPESSQGLVFSKTSLQRHRIDPAAPRALYFNDEVYVGYCQQGDVLEVSSADPLLGTAFYTVDQHADRATFARQTDNCLICHASSQSQDVPGHVLRSVFVDAGGQPILSEGTYRTDHRSPLAERWGGWYVTGTHGAGQHLGNLLIRQRTVARPVDNRQGLNVTSLEGRIDTADYLNPHSDIVAHLVLAHQTMAHNLLSRANLLTRQALYYEEGLNRELGKPAGERWPSTTSRIRAVGDPLVECLLFAGEAGLDGPVAGTSTFAAEFSGRGPRDRLGRSLRDFDLHSRLFRYPLSYLVYSPSFDRLPAEARNYVLGRMRDILRGADPDPKFAHLTPADRSAILEILADTRPEWAWGEDRCEPPAGSDQGVSAAALNSH